MVPELELVNHNPVGTCRLVLTDTNAQLVASSLHHESVHEGHLVEHITSTNQRAGLTQTCGHTVGQLDELLLEGLTL